MKGRDEKRKLRGKVVFELKRIRWVWWEESAKKGAVGTGIGGFSARDEEHRK